MKIPSMLKATLATAAVLALLIPVAGRKAEAQGHGRHPRYISALSDLRAARGYLNKLTPSERLDADQEVAIREIEAAISDIKRAAVDDGRNIDEHPAVDARILPKSRFQKAREALNSALEDVRKEEDDPQSKGLQQRSIDHIHNAGEAIHKIQIRLHLE